MNKFHAKTALITSIRLVSFSCAAYPCTTFILRQYNSIIFGQNLDWITGNGLIMTNPLNLEKTSLVDTTKRQSGGFPNMAV